MSEPVLQVKGLKTYYARAVPQWTDSVEPERNVYIVGSSCGKSVTSLSILRLIPSPPGKIDGEIIYHGGRTVKKSEREMRSIRGNDASRWYLQEPMTSLNPSPSDSRLANRSASIGRWARRKCSKSPSICGLSASRNWNTSSAIIQTSSPSPPKARWVPWRWLIQRKSCGRTSDRAGDDSGRLCAC